MATTNHVTIRLAWHDNRWDGRICRDPKRNVYCNGTHSLLSSRIEREKDADLEAAHATEKLDALLPNYVPPCFWSSNLFSAHRIKVFHRHPFERLKDKVVRDTLASRSVFTWPFRLAYNHSQARKRADGSYPRQLEERVAELMHRDRLQPGKSLCFFYLNYDNPVSADDGKYALVGFGKLAKPVGNVRRFPFSNEELEEWRSKDKMQNFPPSVWAISVSVDPRSLVRLPYHEYLEHIEKHPEAETKLDEIKALVDEWALLPYFKYVSEVASDDISLFLLYKMRKIAGIIRSHGIVDFTRESKAIERALAETWARRGLYPGLGPVIDFLIDPDSEEPNVGDAIAAELSRQKKNGSAIDQALALFSSTKTSPKLKMYQKQISSGRRNFRDRERLWPALKKLALISLSKAQLRNIVLGRDFDPAELARNPYALAEEYESALEGARREEELDRTILQDLPIGLFQIDVGMFPDTDFIEPDEELQDLSPLGPERMRLLILERLRNSDEGHSYLSLNDICDYIKEYPLFFTKNPASKLTFRPEDLLTEKHRKHYSPALTLQTEDGQTFFYLSEVFQAERSIGRITEALLSRRDIQQDFAWIEGYLGDEARALEHVPGFDLSTFRTERTRLLRGALSKALFVVTGRPGSGKTFALKATINRLQALGEPVTVLAPTGKAALRIADQTGFKDAQTIDRFVFKLGLGGCLEDLRNLSEVRQNNAHPIRNLIIDEASMVDLDRLAILFTLLERQGLESVRRIILVGDEHQLPPIGRGRPFHDICSFLTLRGGRNHPNFVELRTNCRQQHDPKVLQAAECFAQIGEGSTELLNELRKGGEISPWLNVAYWKTPEELWDTIDQHLLDSIKRNTKETEREKGLNFLFGLYDNGFVKQNSASTTKLDAFQILTPYRAGSSGTLGINEQVRRSYRSKRHIGHESAFRHADKIIRVLNWYVWDRQEHRKRLLLSNGSIGVVCDHHKDGAKAYFPEEMYPIRWGDEENFEAAYAITIHKAQGSEFDEVFVVLPERKALLSRELVYTALTRSKGRVALLVQDTGRGNPIDVARENSAVLLRNSSLLSSPVDASRAFKPEPGVSVLSKIEFIIYRALMRARDQGKVNFHYERPLDLRADSGVVQIKPDFTVSLDGRTYYWEHLGMLDRPSYVQRWHQRRRLYEANGLRDFVVTTDDSDGIDQTRIEELIEALAAGKIPGSSAIHVSAHHYSLQKRRSGTPSDGRSD